MQGEDTKEPREVGQCGEQRTTSELIMNDNILRETRDTASAFLYMQESVNFFSCDNL